MLQQILEQIYPLDNYYVIVANGEFPKHPYLHKLISKAKKLICCDGAIHKLSTYRLIPDYIIGDCDSLQILEDGILNDRIIKIPDQNTNDLTKAVNFTVQELKAKKIVILGATGLREDHAIANIALLAKYINFIAEIAIISEYGIFTVHNKSMKLPTIQGQQISFFTLDPYTTINCSELKWPLVAHQFNAWYQGTLNQTLGSYITLNTNGTTIIYRAFEIKTIDNNKQ
jgi:thiamine pyrophosphokinase